LSYFQKQVLEAMSDSEDKSHEIKLEPPKKRKRQTIPKYSNYCKKYDIPYPNISARESEHLDVCPQCQELWPLFLFKHEYTLNKSFNKVLEEWSELTEKDRCIQLKDLLKEDKVWKKSINRRRAPSGYQLFLREQRKSDPEMKLLKFGDCTTLIAKIWSGFSEEKKQVYNDQSAELKQDGISKVEALPKFKKRIYVLEKRKFRKLSKSQSLKKPSNPFMLYLNDKWSLQKSNPGMKYRDMMKSCSAEWDTLPETQKTRYNIKFMQLRESYMKKKAEQENEEKQEKETKRALKKAKLSE